MANKNIGDKTEKKCLEEISKNGWWCHLFAYNVNGQPCDIIALRKKKSLLIDVKHCNENFFEVRRIEPNQACCFTYASSLEIECGFALYSEIDKKFFWLPWQLVKAMPNLKRFKLGALIDFEKIIKEGK